VSKAADGRSTIIQRADGWHGFVSFGTDPATGKRRRKHVRGKTKSEVAAKVAALERQREGGFVGGPGTTVGVWLDAWIEARRALVRPKTLEGYLTDARRIKAHLGGIKLARLTPEHIESLWSAILDEGLSPASVAHCRRTLSACLQTAVDRGYLARNPVRLAKAPRLVEREVTPLTRAEVQKILAVARSKRNAARWSVALALGLRQGEALGLRWADVDLEAGTLAVRRQLGRAPYSHGCASDANGEPTCGAARASACPWRTGGPALVEPKSQAGHRTIHLPRPLVAELIEHRRKQAEERLAAGSLWANRDLVFANPFGRPVGAKADWCAWRDLLQEAGVSHRRLHDARHTAATLLLVLGVDIQTTAAILGHSSTVITQRYSHVVDELRADAAQRMGEALWEV